MKKRILILILLIIIVSIIILCSSKLYPSKKAYLNYLENRYNEEFVIDEEITDYSNINMDILLYGIYEKQIDKTYFKAYRFHVKDNTEQSYIVAYGKFKVAVWKLSKTKIFVDNYDKFKQ